MFRLTLVLLALISTVSFAAVIELPLPRFELLKAAPQTGDDIPGYNLYGVGSRQSGKFCAIILLLFKFVINLFVFFLRSGDQLVGYIANEKTYPAPGGNASTNIQFPYNAPSATITAIQVWFISVSALIISCEKLKTHSNIVSLDSG